MLLSSSFCRTSLTAARRWHTRAIRTSDSSKLAMRVSKVARAARSWSLFDVRKWEEPRCCDSGLFAVCAVPDGELSHGEGLAMWCLLYCACCCISAENTPSLEKRPCKLGFSLLGKAWAAVLKSIIVSSFFYSGLIFNVVDPSFDDRMRQANETTVFLSDDFTASRNCAFPCSPRPPSLQNSKGDLT